MIVSKFLEGKQTMRQALNFVIQLCRMAGLALLLSTAATAHARGEESRSIVSAKPVPGGFSLAGKGFAAPILVDAAEPAAARRAVTDLAADFATVTGQRPTVQHQAAPDTPVAIIIGTLGQSSFIDAMAKDGRLSTAQIAGKWESFLIATVDRPLPGIAKALVIAGSDRRGTAYGVYELSQAIGVHPWNWWADIAPRQRNAIHVAPGLRRFGPPSVRYRGIFINDEDWGLHPWAAQTFDPERKDIGPKTYARVFELMLRLKANTLWPAMHKTTAAFNSDPANARLAEDYGIVMGSSHAEAMLRNNVGEWTAPQASFNYATNSDAVRAYWDERVRVNAGFENIWTVGMRGLHDTGMVGTRTIEEKVSLLDRIIADQRALIDKHVPGGAAAAPQIFVPYKEVLEIYRAGLKVPDNVTIVWPDDNFGYIRQFPSKAEAARAGGTGVYYHLSYLGYPLAYMWLASTPPALVREEMVRAWDEGSRNLWIVNVGDIKPAEISTTHFLDMAWDIDRWRTTSQKDYLRHWLRDVFGSTAGERSAAMMDEYFLLNSQRRPEHLEWPARDEDRHLSSFSVAEVNDRLRRWRRLAADAQALAKTIPADRRDAWFELVEYPVRAAAAANMQFFAAERYDELVEVDPPMARSAGGAVAMAEAEIKDLTRQYNKIAGGKWRHLMPAEAADSQWRIYRPRPIVTPAEALRTSPDLFLAEVDNSPRPNSPVVEAEDMPTAPGWRLVEGVGRGRGSVVADEQGKALTATFNLAPGQSGIALGLLPMFPDGDDRDLKLEVSIDGAAAQTLSVPRQVGSAPWVVGVLENLLTVPVPATLTPGPHRIAVIARSGGIALDRLILQQPAAHAAAH